MQIRPKKIQKPESKTGDSVKDVDQEAPEDWETTTDRPLGRHDDDFLNDFDNNTSIFGEESEQPDSDFELDNNLNSKPKSGHNRK